jgi:8-amino-7-oxononanoate synthase
MSGLPDLPFDFEARLGKGLSDRKENCLFRFRQTTPSNGVLDLRSNDYLCLARDPKVLEAAAGALAMFGASASASPLVSGYLSIHKELEGRLAQFHGYPHALLMVSGHAANRSVLGALVGAEDLVLVDRLVHQSILSGVMASGAKFRRFPHNDLVALEKILIDKKNQFRQVFVATESLFSMDGDGPDLVAFSQLRQSFGFVWILDEAHAIGWHGETGAGKLEEFGVKAAADIVVGTLGKALGSQGAYVLAHNEAIIDHIVNHAGEYIYSTFLSPVAAGAALGALEQMRLLANQRRVWQDLSLQWRSRIRDWGVYMPQDNSPIIPILMGDEKKALEKTKQLANQGVLVSCVRPPTVPKGGARLRVSLNRNLNPSDLERFEKAWGNPG